MADAILYGSTFYSSLSLVNYIRWIICLFPASAWICTPSPNKQTTTQPPPVSEIYSKINSVCIAPLHSINNLVLVHIQKIILCLFPLNDFHHNRYFYIQTSSEPILYNITNLHLSTQLIIIIIATFSLKKFFLLYSFHSCALKAPECNRKLTFDFTL